MAENEYRQVISFQTKGTSDLKAATEAVERLKKEAAEFMKAGGVTAQFGKNVQVVDRVTMALNKEGEVVHKLTRSITDNRKAEEKAAREAEKARKTELRDKQKAFIQQQKQLNQELKERTKVHKLEEAARVKEEAAAARNETRQKKIEERQKKMADREATMLRNRGLQGFMQGLSVPGLMSYIPSKKGIGRQMAGFAFGRALSVGAGAISGGLISGIQGVEAAISGIPGLGPGAAAILGQQRQAGEAAIDFTLQGRRLLQLAPGAMASRAGAIAGGIPGAAAAGMATPSAGRAASSAIQALQNQLFLTQAEKYGLTPQEAQSTVMSALNRSGLQVESGKATAGSVQTALDAMALSARGYDPTMAGTVGRARRLGISATQTRSADDLIGKIEATAKAGGMDQADVPILLEKILKELEVATAMGMQPDLRAQTAGALGLRAFGLGAAGAQALSSIAGNAAVSAAQQGPQGLDWLLMSAFGFEKPGLPDQMSPAKLLEGRLNLERKTYMSDSGRFAQGIRFMQGTMPNDPAGAAAIIARTLGRTGTVPVEIENMLAQGLAEPGGLTADRLNELLNLIPGAEAARPGATDLVPEEATRVANLERRRVVAGREMTDTLLTFEDARMKILEKSTETFAESLNKLARVVDEIATKIQRFGHGGATEFALDYGAPAVMLGSGAANAAFGANYAARFLDQNLQLSVDLDQ